MNFKAYLIAMLIAILFALVVIPMIGNTLKELNFKTATKIQTVR